VYLEDFLLTFWTHLQKKEFLHCRVYEKANHPTASRRALECFAHLKGHQRFAGLHGIARRSFAAHCLDPVSFRKPDLFRRHAATFCALILDGLWRPVVIGLVVGLFWLDMLLQFLATLGPRWMLPPPKYEEDFC
jgi:hypothetical protein